MHGNGNAAYIKGLSPFLGVRLYPISRCRDSMRRLTPEFVLMSSASTSRLLSMAFTSSALAKRTVRVRLPLPSSLAKVARMRPFICCTSLSNTSFSTTTSTFGKSRSLGCMFFILLANALIC